MGILNIISIKLREKMECKWHFMLRKWESWPAKEKES